jgi:hypothetical protein
LKEKTDGMTSSLNERLQVFEKERLKTKKEKDAKHGKGHSYKGPGALLCQFCKQSTFDPGHGDISAAAGLQMSGNYSSCIRKVTEAEEAAAEAAAEAEAAAAPRALAAAPAASSSAARLAAESATCSRARAKPASARSRKRER